MTSKCSKASCCTSRTGCGTTNTVVFGWFCWQAATVLQLNKELRTARSVAKECVRMCDAFSTLLCTQQCQIKIDALCIPLFFTNPESNIGWTPQCVSMCFSQQVGKRFGFDRRGRGAWGSWGYQVPCNIILSSWPRKVPIPNVPPLRCQERLPEFDGRHAAWSRFETTFAWNVSSTSQMPWIIRAGQVVTFS